MRIRILFTFSFIIISSVNSQISFDKYFTSNSLRIDYIQTASADTSYYAIDQLKKEPYWGGSMTNLIDTFRYGTNIIEVYDSASGQLIYSRGYATLCDEWKTTEEAKSILASFEESILMPFPKQTIRLTLLWRDKNNTFHKVLDCTINPANYFIHQEDYSLYKTDAFIKNAYPSKAVDIVFLPDGYTQKEMYKFRKDALRYASIMLSWKPFIEYQKHFNFWMVEVPSKESGTDLPGENIWVHTALNTNFYTFGTDRYLTTSSIKAVRDAAGHVPYDQIYILVNTKVYGGGGIYNFYSVCASDNEGSEFVFCHEFGHAFTALADEYYDSETSYQEFYNLEVEPYEPNITTLVDFDSKWKCMVDSLTPVPTPCTEEYKNKIGVFEGGGYVEKGIYRPTYNSSMKSGVINNFGPVNERAIIQMIRFYSE